MKAYSEDLRRKIVDALKRGTTKNEAASLFGVSLSSVKRFARMDRDGVSLAPRKPPGRPPKSNDITRRLLEADLADRPAATASERRRYLERMTGESMSDSTLRRLVRRLGHSRNKITPRLRARRVPESGLAGDGVRGALRQKARVRGRDGIEHLPSRALCLFSQRREGVLLGSAKPRQEHDPAFEHGLRWDGSFYGGRGGGRRGGFRDLSAGGAPARTQRRGRGGDGQPLCPQEREGQRDYRGCGRARSSTCRPTHRTSIR